MNLLRLLLESCRIRATAACFLPVQSHFVSPAEEAAGAGGPDGSFILLAEAHPENQQVQPPAAGRSHASWLTQAERRDPRAAALSGRVRAERVRARSHEQ